MNGSYVLALGYIKTDGQMDRQTVSVDGHLAKQFYL